MAEPKKKSSKTRSKQRRSHQALTSQNPSRCRHCGASVMSHKVCKNCGYYKGKKVIEIK